MRNKPYPDYFFLKVVGVAFLAGAFAEAFVALGLLFDLAVAIIIIFKLLRKCTSVFDS
jgi:low temperature requirement protein LtrA